MAAQVRFYVGHLSLTHALLAPHCINSSNVNDRRHIWDRHAVGLIQRCPVCCMVVYDPYDFGRSYITTAGCGCKVSMLQLSGALVAVGSADSLGIIQTEWVRPGHAVILPAGWLPMATAAAAMVPTTPAGPPLHCTVCHEANPYAVANLPNGKFACYSCRSTRAYLLKG